MGALRESHVTMHEEALIQFWLSRLVAHRRSNAQVEPDERALVSVFDFGVKRSTRHARHATWLK